MGIALGFSAVFRAVCAIRPGHGDEPLTIQTIAVVAVIINPAFEAVLHDGRGATGDGRQTAQGPTHAEWAVAALAVIVEG